MKKTQMLQQMRCFNPYAKQVKSPLFEAHLFFDPEDKLQVKYEMLRAVQVEGMSVSAIPRTFGLSRETYYKTDRAFRQEGVVGLLDKNQGRRRPDKLVNAVVSYILSERKKDPPNNSGGILAQKVFKKFKIRVHARTIYKVLKKMEHASPKAPSSP